MDIDNFLHNPIPGGFFSLLLFLYILLSDQIYIFYIYYGLFLYIENTSILLDAYMIICDNCNTMVMD